MGQARAGMRQSCCAMDCGRPEIQWGNAFQLQKTGSSLPKRPASAPWTLLRRCHLTGHTGQLVNAGHCAGGCWGCWAQDTHQPEQQGWAVVLKWGWVGTMDGRWDAGTGRGTEMVQEHDWQTKGRQVEG